MNTKNKIDNILNEIESPHYEPLSAQQIINRILSKDEIDNSDSNMDNDDNNKKDQEYKLDIETLSSCTNNNNQLYYVNYYYPLRSNRRIIAKLLIFLRKIIRKIIKFLFDPILDRQNRFNGSVTASINALLNNEIVTQDFIDSISNKFIDVNKIITDLNNQILELNDKLKISDNQLLELNNKLKISDNQLLELNDKLKISDNQLLELNNKLKISDSQLLELKNDVYSSIENIKQNYLLFDNQLDYVSFKIHQLEKNNTIDINETDINSVKQTHKVNDQNTYQSIDYFDFENHFRGIRQNIKDSQRDYLKYFKDKKNVLDLGCGRGEFLELLKESNINAIGVDLYKDFVDYCNFKNLKAINDDIIRYLEDLNDESIDGIMCSQVVEHLTTDQILSLCNLTYKKLQSNSYIIIETPNPTSLSIYTNWFYVDPSHIKPIHPKTLEYFLKKAGFNDIQVVYTEQSKVGYRLPLLDSQNINNISDFNDGINLLSDIIFGSQDYAIIARK